MNLQNPCTHCKRVRKPAQCDNIRCMSWRNYFLGRWDMIHRKGMQLLKEGKE